MIARLTGEIIYKDGHTIVLEVAGVGYEVLLSAQAAEHVIVGKTATFEIAEQIKEDNYQLFGFVDRMQRQLYFSLISVNGVGPKAAMSILSGHNAEEIEKAILTADTNLFSNVSGIGKKTADRIILELRGKLEFGKVAELADDPAYQALLSLGYTAKQAGAAIKDLPSELNLDQKVKAALKGLAK